MYNTSCAEIYHWLTKEKFWHCMLKSLRSCSAFESEATTSTVHSYFIFIWYYAEDLIILDFKCLSLAKPAFLSVTYCMVTPNINKLP
jgi:hypothetical protein